MAEHKVFPMPCSKVYPMYVDKAERKGRTKDEVDQVICWLTGVVCGVRVESVEDPLMKKIRQTCMAWSFSSNPAPRGT